MSDATNLTVSRNVEHELDGKSQTHVSLREFSTGDGMVHTEGDARRERLRAAQAGVPYPQGHSLMDDYMAETHTAEPRGKVGVVPQKPAKEATTKLAVSKKDWNGALVPKHTAKLINSSFENGTSPFLPVDGKVPTSLVYNVNTGYALDAKDMIPVQLTKIEKGYESNAVGTYNTMSKAGTRVKGGEKGVWFNFKGQDGEFHHSAYFFAEQTEHPERFSELAQNNFKQPQRLANETIKIESPEVSEYLSAYVAACKSGAKLEVSTDVAEQFKQNMLAVTNNELARTNAEKNSEIPKLNDILFNADRKAGELVKSIEEKRGLAPTRQAKQKSAPQKKRARERGKGMER